MESEIKFYKGICEEQTKKIEELKKENQTMRGQYYKEGIDGEFKKMTRDEMIGFCESENQSYNFINEELRNLKLTNQNLQETLDIRGEIVVKLKEEIKELRSR
jgi:hypothetical protein